MTEDLSMRSPRGAVVFLGDSITAEAPWDTLLPGIPGVNRGVSGDTTQDVLDRLDDAVVEPVAVSLLVGTNDLPAEPSLADADAVADRTRAIVVGIRERAPGVPVLLNGVLPRTAPLAATIRLLDERCRVIADELGCTFVDAWPALADGDALRPEFTRDGVHLTPDGYRAWAEVLRPHLARFASA